MNPAVNPIALPSQKGLLLRVLFSLVAALAIVFGFILPAEYQIDPTGFGKLTGLTRMGQGSKPSVSTTAAHTYPGTFRTDEVDLTLNPGEEYEYKVRMKDGGALLYTWKSSAPYEFDFHGESDKDPGNAVSYTTGNAGESHGSLIAPFQGIHGWYWKNHSDKPNDIHLKMAGQYELTVDFSQ
jgi:hypothetical protein